jgi:hypothetical protein
MAKRSRQSFQKHQKEQARRQKQQAKSARRLEAKQRKANADSGPDDTTLDRAGLQPDPQPGPAWGDRISEQASALPREAL